MKQSQTMKARARRIIELTLASLALASAAGAASAQQPPAPGDAMLKSSFTRIDANGDGRLSQDEARRMPEISARFDELDADKDGALSFAEFMAATPPKK